MAGLIPWRRTRSRQEPELTPGLTEYIKEAVKAEIAKLPLKYNIDLDEVDETASKKHAGATGADFIKGTDTLDNITDGSTYKKPKTFIGYSSKTGDAGTQTITIGFTPILVIFFAWSSGGTYYIASWGIDNISSHRCMRIKGDTNSSVSNSDTKSIDVITTPGVYWDAYISATAATTFTLTWAKGGTPQTAQFLYIAFRS